MSSKRLKIILSTVLAASLLSSSALAGQIEVLHWWTSGGEAKSLAELKRLLEASGHHWIDFAVPGGGGESAMIYLKSRVIAGKPPTAAQIKGPSIQEWAAQGVLANLDAVAKAESWDSLLPAVVSNLMKYDDHYVAVPVNVHRVNWLWVNPVIFKQAGAKIPATWEEFDIAARKIQQAGFIPVAHGGQSWQEAVLFEDMVLAIGGADFYRKAFVDLNSQALDSPTMVKAFEVLSMVKKYTDKGAPGRNWNQASAMVIDGKAAMQFMGDWAKGEFSAAGQVPGKDYLCIPAPGTQGMFIFNIDSFIMFRVNDPEAQKAQLEMAHIIMEPEFQERFNLTKGSIPVRLNISMEKFDACAQDSMDEFVKSAKDGTLVPSMSQGMATFSSVQGAIYDVVTEFYNSAMSSEDAAKKLAQTVEANR